MAIGTILFHSRHGKLIVTKKAYSPVSNSVVWYASDVTGTERPLDGTERTEAEVRAEENEITAEKIKAESKESESKLIREMFSHIKLIKGSKGEKGDSPPLPVIRKMIRSVVEEVLKNKGIV